METSGREEAIRIMGKAEFHHAPKHASWLNMAEIKIGVMSTQAIRGRIPTKLKLVQHIAAWQKRMILDTKNTPIGQDGTFVVLTL